MSAQHELSFCVRRAPQLTTKQGAAARIYDVLCASRRWWTLAELAGYLHATGATTSEAAISARLRELRRAPFNAFLNKRRRAGNLWEYATMAGGAA